MWQRRAGVKKRKKPEEREQRNHQFGDPSAPGSDRSENFLEGCYGPWVSSWPFSIHGMSDYWTGSRSPATPAYRWCLSRRCWDPGSLYTSWSASCWDAGSAIPRSGENSWLLKALLEHVTVLVGTTQSMDRIPRKPHAPQTSTVWKTTI